MNSEFPISKSKSLFGYIAEAFEGA